MIQVPAEIWFKVAGYLECPNPVLYTRLAGISSSAFSVFTSDNLWKGIAPRNTTKYHFENFLVRVSCMDFESRALLTKSWAAVDEFTCQKRGKRENHLVNSTDALYFRENLELAAQNPELLLPIAVWYSINSQSNSKSVEACPLIQNREFVEVAVSIDGRCLRLSRAFWDDFDIVLEAVSKRGEMLEFASERLKLDHTIVLAAVSNFGTALRFVDSTMAANRDIALRAVQSHGWALQRVAQRLQEDREIVLSAVINYCGVLQFASEKLRSDKVVVTAAAAQQGWTLQYATPKLRDDIDVVMAAINCEVDAIKYASPRLRDNKQLMLAVTAKNGSLLRFASPRLQKDTDLVMIARSTDSESSTAGVPGAALYAKYASWIMETWDTACTI